MDKRTVSLYLMDGTPNGRIKCTMDNWHGVAFRIPRTDLSKCESRDETGKMKTTAFDRFWLLSEKRSF